MAVRDSGAQPLSLGCLAMQARHVGGRPGPIDEDETPRIELDLPLEPVPAPLKDIRAALLGGMRGLLSRVIPLRLKKRHSVLRPAPTPLSARRVCSSASVMSGCSSTSDRTSPAAASMRPERRSPPNAFAPKCPSRRRRSCQRIALEALTPNRSAARRHDIPPSTDARTRSRRSIDKALAMHAGPLHQHAASIRTQPIGESPAIPSARKPL